MSKPRLSHQVRTFNKTKNETYVVIISLDDNCNNGHADFSITASIYSGTRCTDRNMIAGGCCHDEILAEFPQFKPFIDLHLSDMYGAPMHATANGYYRLRNEDKTPDERKTITKEEMRVDAAQFEILNTAEDKDHFHFLIESLGLPCHWLAEAQAGIVQLEKLTGEKWDSEYKWKRSQYVPMTAGAKESMQANLEAGYYTPEAIQKRKEQAETVAYNNKIAKIKQDADTDIAKIRCETRLFLWLHAKNEALKKKFRKRNIEFNLFADNCIYYNHSKTLTFNWVGYQSQTTPESFKRFMDNITESDFQTKLPAGITINCKTK